MQTVKLPDGTELPAMGQGTWHMGRDSADSAKEVEALQHGMDLGLTVIDTAEMYDDAETVVGKAIKGRRDEVFIVSKVLPHHASKKQTSVACEHSLERLGIDCIDLYLLHWPGEHPLEETLEAFEKLVDAGKIARYGVSNFDTAGMQKAYELPGGSNIQTNQVLYNLHERGIEWDLLPWCEEHDMPIMAYSPLNQGDLAPDVLEQIAMRYNVNRYEVALAWLLHRPQVMAIPKSSNIEHINKNHQALELEFSAEELKVISATFTGPSGPTPLSMI